MRIIVLILTLAFASFVTVPMIAEAQAPAQPPAGPSAQAAQAGQAGQGPGGVRASVVKKSRDRVESGGKGMALLFWAFAAASVGGALFVVTRRNLIAAVMGMVGSFLGISAVYMMLYAHFLAIIQMLVYAGAIMVLFVFVIMILNRPEDEPVAPSGRVGQGVGAVAILYLVYRLVMLLVNVRMPNEQIAMNAPAPVTLDSIKPLANPPLPGEVVDWGSTKAVGMDLFGPGLFPFETISILLLIAIVGAIAIARPVSDDPHAGEAGTTGGVA